jgi:predicted MPP superfamily phosphohydrolase
MLHHVVGWMRTHSKIKRPRGHWARWLGRHWAHLTYAVKVEPTWLELNHYDVPVAGLPDPFAGLRIVQLSDFHCSRQVPLTNLEETVDLAQGQGGDVIVLTGDFIHHGFRYVERIARIVGRLGAPLGVFAVLGNHDFSVRNALGIRRYRDLHRAIADALRCQRIRVLHNETVLLEQQGAHLLLTGVEDLWSRECDIGQAFGESHPDWPRIILAHNPRTIDQLQGRRCDLMLSGHTHGGQINLPKLGRVTLGRKARRLAAGMYRLDNSFLYVNKGVGFGFRVRYGVRPEVAVLSLRPVASGEAAPAEISDG